MKQLRGLDLKRAQLVPSSVFASPDEVLRHPELSAAQKLAILRRWEFDARRVAGFTGARPGSRDATLLLRVRRALRTLGDSTPLRREGRSLRPPLSATGVVLDEGEHEPAPPLPLFGDAAALDDHRAGRKRHAKSL